ncbi:MAG TPA: alpha-glucosidase [Acidisarcina sp.]|nr:alpha-glucosidase [Acidisarcina sp.]
MIAAGKRTGIVATLVLLLSSLALQPAWSQAQKSGKAPAVQAATTAAEPWWKHAVFYEIYPISYQDTNGDGRGDLKGITQRLDYLKTLGIDAIWLTPIYPSPLVDFGYDISNYVAIDPRYGTMADFDKLIAEAKKRNIHVLMDFVMNHTSDKHPWFLQSESSKTNPKRDWYVWKDGKGPNQPPNNWESGFGHSAWQFDPKTGQYYYHKFYIQQPDLNWNNPKVKTAMFDAARFWLRRGVAGFRLDAVDTLFEDPDLTDEEVVKDKDGKPILNAYGDPQLVHSRTNNLPKLHEVLMGLRTVTDTFPGDRVLVGETYMPNIAELAKMYGPKNDELQLPMDTQIGMINKLDVATFRQKILESQTGLNGNLPMIVFDNHDNPRMDARYGDGVHNEDIQRVLSTVLFTTRGVPLMYYGDEIGMKTTPPARKEDVKDPIGITGWPKEKGRDGERTPMQWDDSANAGFTTGTPWLPIPADYKTVNVKDEIPNFNSLLNWYKELIALRRTQPSLRDGNYVALNTTDNNVLAWLRQAPGKPAVVVACNFTAAAQKISINLTGVGLGGKSAKTLMKTPGSSDPASLSAIQLPPFGVYIGEVQ